MLFKRCKCAGPCSHSYWYKFEMYKNRYEASTRTANKQTATRIADKRRVAVLEHREGIAPLATTKLSALIKDYQEACEAEHKTSNKDVRVLKQFQAHVGDRPISDVTAFAIDKWKRDRAKSVSQSTVNRELNVIRGLFSRAVVWKKLKKSPMPDVQNFKVDDIRVRVLSDEEIRRVVQDAPATEALICRVTLEALLRLSEVLGLRVEHIGGAWMEVRRKGGRVDRIGITPELRADLLAHAHKDGYVFGAGTKGNPPTQAAMSVRYARLFNGWKLSGVSHHTMRHTGITIMLENGVNPRVIQRLAGWSSLRMLERYGHVRDAEMLRAVTATRAHVDAAVAGDKNGDTAVGMWRP
jgi:integrase